MPESKLQELARKLREAKRWAWRCSDAFRKEQHGHRDHNRFSPDEIGRRLDEFHDIACEAYGQETIAMGKLLDHIESDEPL